MQDTMWLLTLYGAFMVFQLFAKFASSNYRKKELSALVADEMSLITECRGEIRKVIAKAARETDDVVTQEIASRVDKFNSEFKKRSDINVGATVLRWIILAVVLAVLFPINMDTSLTLDAKFGHTIGWLVTGLVAYGVVGLLAHESKYDSVVEVSELVNAVWHLGEKHIYVFDRLSGHVRVICYDTIRKAEVSGDYIGFYGRSGRVVRMKNPAHHEPAKIAAKINELIELNRK
jgi:hypothetical protein